MILLLIEQSENIVKINYCLIEAMEEELKELEFSRMQYNNPPSSKRILNSDEYNQTKFLIREQWIHQQMKNRHDVNIEQINIEAIKLEQQFEFKISNICYEIRERYLVCKFGRKCWSLQRYQKEKCKWNDLLHLRCNKHKDEFLLYPSK